MTRCTHYFSTVTDKYGTTSTQVDPIPQITSEGWHNKLKKKVSHVHPNIYTLISTFNDIQVANEVTRIPRNAGGTIRPKAKRYRDIDSRLIQLKERLTSGSIDVVQYSDAAPHLLHLD